MDSEQLQEIEEKHGRLAETHVGSMDMENFLYQDLPPVFMALREAWVERSNRQDKLVIARAEMHKLEIRINALQDEKEGNAEAYERMVVGRQRLKNEIVVLRGELEEARRINRKVEEEHAGAKKAIAALRAGMGTGVTERKAELDRASSAWKRTVHRYREDYIILLRKNWMLEEQVDRMRKDK